MAITSTMAAVAAAASLNPAIIAQNPVALRAAPRDAAQQQAELWQGEMVEIRGERMNYLQVYDHRRERAGFVRADQVRRTGFTEQEAPELLSVLRFVRETPGAEALGIAYAAAYLKAAPAQMVNGEGGIEALDALGSMAERLAQRASSGTLPSKLAEGTLAAHLEVAAQYGVKFTSYEIDSRMHLCYDGEAFRRVLAMSKTPEQQARAALALTRPDCASPSLPPLERGQLDAWRADVLDRVDTAKLPGYLKNRVLMRRASVWSTLAFQRARSGNVSEPGHAPKLAESSSLAQRAMTELSGVSKSELTDDDMAAYNDAAMRANASRWAAVPASRVNDKTRQPYVIASRGQPGETCVALLDASHDAGQPLIKRCTYGVVWTASATLNREGNALALAVQPMESWRELWLFRKTAQGWTINVLPPATTTPETGYAEFAGWAPGGKQVLVAREARGEGKYRRSFEVVNLDTLSTERRAATPDALGAFQRWEDPGWKRSTLSLR